MGKNDGYNNLLKSGNFMNGMNYCKISKILFYIYLCTNVLIAFAAFITGYLIADKYFLAEKIPKFLFTVGSYFTGFAPTEFFRDFLKLYFIIGFLPSFFLKLKIKYKFILIGTFVFLHYFLHYTALVIRHHLFRI